MQSIKALVGESAEKFNSKTFLYFKNRKISFKEVNRISNLVASAFQDKGIRTGDRVALMLTNRPEFLYFWYGLNKIGASMVPIDTGLAAYEVEYILRHSEARIIATEKPMLTMIQDARKNIPHIDNIILLDGVGESSKWVSFTSFIAGVQEEAFDKVHIDSSTEAAILYTRKMGVLKGCIVDQSYYLNIGELYVRENKIEASDRIVVPLPLSQMDAQGMPITGALMKGAGIILLDSFKPQTWWKTIREKGATNFHYLGFIPAMLLESPETPYDYDSQKAYGVGAGCPKDIHAEFEERFNVEMLECYGSIESGMCFMMGLQRHRDRKIGMGTFGTPLPEYEAQVVDDNDQEVPRRTVGELVVRSSDPLNRKKGMMKEYYKDPEATKQAWRNEWFHTGDLCFVDEDNYFYFVERKQDSIL